MKNLFVFRWVSEKPIHRGNCLKRGVSSFADLRRGTGEKEEGVFEGVFSVPFWKTVHSMTLPNQLFPKHKNFSDSDCMTAELYKNVYQKNSFRLRMLGNTVSEKNWNWVETDASAQSPYKNKLLLIVVKMSTDADFKVSYYCPILLDFFT